MNCKNCQTVIAETNDYCHDCGARVIRNRLTLKNLMTQLSEEFLNYDNRLLKTLIHLIKCPEVVIGSYVQGIRKRYMNPVSFFAISLTLSGLIGFITTNYFDNSVLYGPLDNGTNKEFQDKTFDFTTNYTSLITSVTIPFFAIISWIVFFNRKYNFTEHIILYLYTYSEYAIITFFGSLGILLIDPSLYGYHIMALILINFIYFCYVLIRVFKLNLIQFLIKTLFFLAIMVVIMILWFILLFALAVVGVIDLKLFVPQP
ncbi:DUF3667 domain-containing protein [Leptobacterium flavescens]|uniref:DUF3667 domain-containing protein n=1 Tax=Leptobacterium flavescens TaxID=472055 RepID=A0A6P0UQZ8_9FLAO|nr:DUF3667 domain-containing protein [Leptobacterium flavescens]NER15317.1 DUF3667 domain-containing protein [Leptobacterium flavescens]